MSHSKSAHTTSPGSGGARGMVGAAIIAVISIIFILYLYDKKQDAPPANTGSGQSGTTTPNVTPVHIVEQQQVGSLKKPFKFTDYQSGCIPINIRDDFELYSFNADTITIQDPAGKVHIVPPSSDWRPGYSVAKDQNIYTFCDPSPGPTDRIEIWSSWDWK